MGIGDFWLKPNNKKALDEFNGEIKRQDLSSKFDALFNIWDKDKSGKLEANEVSSIFNQIAESERVDDQEFLGEIFTKVSKANADDLAKRFFKIAEDNNSNKSMKEFQKFLDEEVTADNILDLLDAYDNPDIKKQDSSLIDTVVSEKLMSGDKTSQKKVLLTILDKVCEAARKYGVAEDDINNARKDFENSIKEEYGSLSSMFRMADSLKMERAIDFLRGAILIKQNQVKDVDSKDAMLTVTEQFYSDNETAYDEFNIERSATAKFGDWVCGLFGCKTLDDMKSKLDMNVEGASELLTALVNEDEEAFKVAYKKLFGIEFDPQKIAAAQELSEKVSAIQMLTSNLQVFEEIKNSSNLEEILKEKFKYSDEVIEEIIKDYPAENKDESLKLFIEESFNNAKDMILELSDGKTLEQLGNDVELATKSAYGDNDISKEITKFNQNMVLTEAFADSAFEILGTIALTMIPVVGQLGAAALAARTAKMGSNMVKVTNMLRKTSVAMYKANKFQQGTKYTSKVKNYGARAISASVNSATATAGVNTWSDKDIKEILKKTIMNSSFSWIGVTSNTIAPILMSKFNITSKLAIELAEEILNVMGAYGVTKANGADYTQNDAVIDLVTGLILARIAGAGGKNVETKPFNRKTSIEERLADFKPEEVAIIEKYRKQFPELIEVLLSSKNKDGEFINNDFYSIYPFISRAISNPESKDKIIYLLKMTDIDGYPRFNSRRIDILLMNYIDNPDFMNLAEMRLPNGKYRFELEQICRLLDIRQENLELYNILVNSKDSNGNYRISCNNKSCFNLNYSMQDGYKTNKERFLKLLNAEGSDGNYLIKMDKLIDVCDEEFTLGFLSKFSDEVLDKMTKEKGLFELFYKIQMDYCNKAFILKDLYDIDAIVNFFNENINKMSIQELETECEKISAKFQYKVLLKYEHKGIAYMYFDDVDKFVDNNDIDRIKYGFEPNVDLLKHLKEDITEPILNDINQVKSYVKDEEMLSIINTMLEKANNQDYGDRIKTLREALYITDIYNNLTENYTTFHRKNSPEKSPYYKKLLKYFDKNDPQKAKALRAGDMSTLSQDFREEMRVTMLVQYCKNKESFPEIADYLYNNTYVKNLQISEVLQDKLVELNKKYGIKLFISTENTDLNKVIEFVDEELTRWQKASGGKAKIPPTLDLLVSKRNYYDKKSAYGQGVAAGFCESSTSGAVSINGVNIDRVKYALRHEITHANDKKLLSEFPPLEGYKNKTKHRDEFRKAGIPEGHIDYAYNNPKEFIAVAAEGDLSQYSPKFKQILINFGMPKWLFELDNVNTKIILKTDYPDFIKNRQNYKFQTKDIDETVNDFIKHYSESAPQIKQYLEDFGLSGLGNTRSRVKGYQSLHDKITNFLKDKPNATYEDVWNEIRDCFGARTVIDPTDFKNHPAVKDLIKKGDMDGAIRRAAELQSEPLVQEFKNIIDKNCSGDKRITTARISNYVSEDGIPYLSEAQLAEIKQYAASKGVKINIVEKLAKDDPHYAEAMAAGYKPTTKSQPSGYTALQINFKTTDGDVFEWQYRGALVDNFAEGEHIPYDLRTGKDIIGEHEELRPLYEPLQKMLSKDNMPKEVYAQYNKYLTDYYTHLRKLELGFESTPPKLSDYEINGFKFDSVLEAENLIKIHEIADDLKHNKISQQDAINKYKKLTQG